MKKDFYMLIIEDEEILAEQTRKMIEENCKFVNRIKIVNSGEKGIEELNKEMPDFIILNQYMPGGITGLEMLERCHSLDLKLPEVIVITGGLKSKFEEDRFYELGVSYISSRLLNEIQKKYIFYHIEKAYKESIKIDEEDMIRLLQKQTDPILENLDRKREPYQVRLMEHILRYIIENRLEYSKDEKIKIYKELKNKNHLEEKMINEIQGKIEGIIEENYTQGNPIRKLNYGINKDEIQEEFFHKLKENVLNDIIAESN